MPEVQGEQASSIALCELELVCLDTQPDITDSTCSAHPAKEAPGPALVYTVEEQSALSRATVQETHKPWKQTQEMRFWGS